MGGETRANAEKTQLQSGTARYQHIVVYGLPYDRGLSHGKQARDKIARNLEYYKQPGKLPPWPLILCLIQECYVPGLEKYFPSALEEMRGIADGANVPIEDIIMLNARYDLSRFKSFGPPADSECTSSIFLSGATQDGSVITAQNWDMAAHLYLSDTIIYLEIHPHPSENIPSMFIVTEAGQLCRSGMNSAGFGLTANSLQSSWDYNPLDTECKPLVPASLIRRLFLHQTILHRALKALAECPVHVSSNITVATSENFGFCFEVTPRRMYRLTASPASPKPYLIHTNHFLHPDFTQNNDVTDGYRGGSSWYRSGRLELGIQSAAGTSSLSEKSIQDAFKDHMGYPYSLCEHIDENRKKGPADDKNPYAGPNCTVVNVAYNLTQGRITVCKGPPCLGVFEVFELKAK